MGKDTSERITLRVSPLTSYKLHILYKRAGCKNMSDFVEKAVDFYLEYIETNDAGEFLPAALKSYLDGRLGMLEDHMSSLLFKQAVEMDMAMGIAAGCLNLDEEFLRQRRAKSVQAVKRTNGRLTFEKKLQERDDETGEDEWQS